MRIKKGVVVQDQADKTIKVAVETSKTHPLYKKKYTIKKNYLVHDPDNNYKIGDEVVFKETIPLSKRKKWVVMNS